MVLSLYIHIPFCQKKCSYCSFSSFEGKEDCIGIYLRCLAQEAIHYRRTPIKTIYIGGGTPTLLNIAQLEELFRIIRSNFIVAEDVEWTVEANPATFDLEKAKTLYALGVNRISLGIQSLNDEYLKFLGRCHNSQEALYAFDTLKKANFSNINLDLIYSLPGQTRADLEQEMHCFVSLGSSHLCAYMLSIPEGSPMHKSGIMPPDEDTQRAHYEVVVQRLRKSGFQHYEVSNFARDLKMCAHNLNYWRGGNYLGLGLAAHSHINGRRFWNTPDLAHYIRKIREGGPAKAGEEVLHPQKRLMESLLIGLRLPEGISLRVLETRCEAKVPEEKRRLINEFIEGGFLVEEESRLKPTEQGLLVLDEIGAHLI